MSRYAREAPKNPAITSQFCGARTPNSLKIQAYRKCWSNVYGAVPGASIMWLFISLKGSIEMNTKKITEYFSTKETASYLGTTPSILKLRRRNGRGPICGMRSGRVCYRATDVDYFRLMGCRV